MDELNRFRQDFKELVDTAYAAIRKKEKAVNKQHLSVLYNSISYLDIRQFVTKEDVEQELRYQWFLAIRSFQKTKPSVHIRTYLIRRSLWSLRDWARSLSLIKTHDHFIDNIPDTTETTHYDFRLDLKFLIHGTEFTPLASLTPYERYLIFLKFREDKSTLEIAEMVQKTYETVYEHINEIIAKVRSNERDAS